MESRIEINYINDNPPLKSNYLEDMVILKENIDIELKNIPLDIKQNFSFTGLVVLTFSNYKGDIILTVETDQEIEILDNNIRLTINGELNRLGYFIVGVDSKETKKNLLVLKLSKSSDDDVIHCFSNEFISTKEQVIDAHNISNLLSDNELITELKQRQSEIHIRNTELIVQAKNTSEDLEKSDYFLQKIISLSTEGGFYILDILAFSYLKIHLGHRNDYKKIAPICPFRFLNSYSKTPPYYLEDVLGNSMDINVVYTLQLNDFHKEYIKECGFANFRGESYFPMKIIYTQKFTKTGFDCAILMYDEGPESLKFNMSSKEWSISIGDHKKIKNLFKKTDILAITKPEFYLVSEYFKKHSPFDVFKFNFDQNILKRFEHASVQILDSIEDFIKIVKWDEVSEGVNNVGKDNDFYTGLKYTININKWRFDPYFAHLLSRQFYKFKITPTNLYPYEMNGEKMNFSESSWSCSYSKRVDQPNVRLLTSSHAYKIILEYNGFEHYECLLENIAE